MRDPFLKVLNLEETYEAEDEAEDEAEEEMSLEEEHREKLTAMHEGRPGE